MPSCVQCYHIFIQGLSGRTTPESPSSSAISSEDLFHLLRLQSLLLNEAELNSHKRAAQTPLNVSPIRLLLTTYRLIYRSNGFYGLSGFCPVQPLALNILFRGQHALHIAPS